MSSDYWMEGPIAFMRCSYVKLKSLFDLTILIYIRDFLPKNYNLNVTCSAL
jgi:hypothetical protein